MLCPACRGKKRLELSNEASYICGLCNGEGFVDNAGDEFERLTNLNKEPELRAIHQETIADIKNFIAMNMSPNQVWAFLVYNSKDLDLNRYITNINNPSDLVKFLRIWADSLETRQDDSDLSNKN